MTRLAMIAVALAVCVTPAAAKGVGLAGVVEPLASKAREISAACGSKIVSAVRKSGATPNHRQGRAVDMQGNPSCIYAHLKDWPGGVSTDYHSVTCPVRDRRTGAIKIIKCPHVHFSYNPRHEWGLRFAHSTSTTTVSAKRARRHEASAPPVARAEAAP
jgi:hypothetical protein